MSYSAHYEEKGVGFEMCKHLKMTPISHLNVENSFNHYWTISHKYTVKIICEHLPYLGATEVHPIWVNFNPGIYVPG